MEPAAMPEWARAADVGTDTEYGRVLRKWERVNELSGQPEWCLLLAHVSHVGGGTTIIFQRLTSGRDAEFFVLDPADILAVTSMLAAAEK